MPIFAKSTVLKLFLHHCRLSYYTYRLVFFNLNSEILYLKSLGKKFDSRQGIVEIMELMLINYYQSIFQHLKRWEKPALEIIHSDFKRTLAAISGRTGLSISQVTDEVLYAGLVKMQELPKL